MATTLTANSQPAPLYSDTGVSIDAYAGTWESTSDFENWWKSEEGRWSEDDIPNGVVIRVKDTTTNKVTIWKRSADAWEQVGGKEYTAGNAIYLNGTDDTAFNVNFGDPQLAFVTDLFAYDGSTTDIPTSGTDDYNINNTGTQANHAAVIWDNTNKVLYVRLSTAIACGQQIASFTSDQGNGLISVSTEGVDVTVIGELPANNVCKVTFSSAPTYIKVVPDSTYLASSWAWSVDDGSRSIVKLSTTAS